jgi:hypothetical protein
MSGITTTTVLATALAASTAVSAIGAIQQGQAQEASYKSQAAAAEYNSQINQNNATVAKYNAQSSAQQAAAAEDAQRRKFAALEGSASAGVAQSGTGFEGSNADVLKQNAVNNELDALNIRYQGNQQKNSFINTSSNYNAQSNLDLMGASAARNNASNAVTGSYLNAGSNLLAGATKYGYYQQTGKL